MLVENNKDNKQLFSVDEAIKQSIESSKVKFDASIDLCLHLGVNAARSDEMVKSMSYMPGGTGKVKTVAVFDDSDKADKIKEAGADFIGLEDLIEKVKIKKAPFFDICIASPEAMTKLRSVSRILGPKGLMPNLKLGTISTDLVNTVKNIKLGSVKYKTDKQGYIHCTLGKASLGFDNIKKNFVHLINDIISLKPQTSKGKYLRRIYVSSTMGQAYDINIKETERAL